MLFTLLIRIAEQPAKADKSAVCAINRHLRVSGVFCQSGIKFLNGIGKHVWKLSLKAYVSTHRDH